MYCNVIVTRPFDRKFTYRIKNNQKVKIGSVVSVPFGKKKDQLGMVCELIHQPEKHETFAIKEIPLSIVYATWSGLGIFTIAIFGYIFYKQTYNKFKI